MSAEPNLPNDLAEKIKFRCAELQQALEQEQPGYKTILQDIHEKIRETPELLYALKDEDIAVLVSGLEKHTGVVIAEKKAKEPMTKKRAAKLTEDDI